jgi:hypothetical protein
MDAIFLYLFFGVCAIMVFGVIANQKLIYEYPYFMGCIFFIFIGPQAVILYNQPYLIPSDSLSPLFLVCFLCLFMAVFGYYYGPAIRVAKFLDARINDQKIINISIVYALLGILFFFLIRKNVSALKGDTTQWSGALTIYVLLFNFVNVAFPLFLHLTLKKFSFLRLFYTFISALPALYFIVSGGRRETTALFFLTIALSFYIKTRIPLPRLLIIGAIVFATLIIPATGDYRRVAAEKGAIEAVKSLDLQESFVNYFNTGGKLLELSVAAHIIDSYSFHGEYVYGAGYWDNMVFRYIPGQLLGKDFKQSLMINTSGTKFKNGYRMYTGLTPTGVGDSFVQFGYLGCFFFFFLGGFFRELWKSSLDFSKPLVYIFYIMCMVQALLAVTHQTINFLPGIFFTFLCLRIAAVYAKE